MGLPPELLPYAENFYRRFPEEFVALGMPGLEQTFDLRNDGTRSRRIFETPTEKVVEITIRRWQFPSLSPPPPSAYPPGQVAGAYHMQTSAGWSRPNWGQANSWQQGPGAAAAGAPWAQGPSLSVSQGPPGYPETGPGVSAAPWSQARPGPDPMESQVTAQLDRLESALSLLKPQIESALLNQARAGQASPPAAPLQQFQPSQVQPAPAMQAPPQSSQKLESPDRLPSAAGQVLSPHSPLRNRRGLSSSLAIAPPTRNLGPSTEQDPAVKQVSRVESEDRSSIARSASPTNQQSKERSKPRINPVRMVPNAMDPESPRSPSKFSVWK